MKNLRITVNGMPYDVQGEELGGQVTTAAVPVISAPVAAPQAPAAVSAPSAPAPALAEAPAAAATSDVPSDAELISSPMPGTIVSVNVKPGQAIKKSDVLVILEAMKMENEIMAPHDAVVAAVHVNKGDSVESGSPLVSLK